jgi:hypothetical protein
VVVEFADDRSGGLMYWHWLSAPPAVLLGVAWMLAGPLLQQRDVTDEVERLISLLVPIVAALLSPLVAAIVLLFRQLVSEMRANREMSERLGRVVQANTLASDANTKASESLAQSVASIKSRIDEIEDGRKSERRRLPS